MSDIPFLSIVKRVIYPDGRPAGELNIHCVYGCGSIWVEESAGRVVCESCGAEYQLKRVGDEFTARLLKRLFCYHCERMAQFIVVGWVEDGWDGGYRIHLACDVCVSDYRDHDGATGEQIHGFEYVEEIRELKFV